MGGHDHTAAARQAAWRARRRHEGLPSHPYRKGGGRGSGYSGWIGFDGEGATIEGRHRYMLLCAADEGERIWTLRRLGGIATEEALDWLVNVIPQNGQKVGFSLGYDWTKILQGMDRELLHLLYHEQLRLNADGDLRPVFWRHWKLNRQGAKVSITDLYTGHHLTAWDSFKFHQCSFVTALSRWQMCSPEELERIARMKEQRSEFAAADWSEGGEVERYCLDECRLLARMMHRICDAWDATGLPRRSYHGAGSLGGAMFQRHDLVQHVAPHPAKVDLPVRRAYFGGRFECSMIGVIPQLVHGYDINSAYAYAELFHPSLHGSWKRGPRSKRELRSIDSEERHVLVELSWDLRGGLDHGQLPAWAPFPVRLQDGTIVYPAAGEGCYWLPEVQAAWRLFDERQFQVRGSWEFHPDEPALRPFAEFIPDYYERRLEWGKEGRGMILKTALAAGYGKTAQRVGKPKWHSLIWAGLTTARTRAMLLDAIAKASHPSQVVMLATDGLWSLEELDLPLGKALGTWDHKVYQRGVFVARPGVYFPLDAEEREEEWEKTVKARGISRRLLKDHADEMVKAWEVGASGLQLTQRRFIGVRSGLRGPVDIQDQVPELDAELAQLDALDVWPQLRRYIMRRGGLGKGDWSADLIPGGLYRSRGIAPDVLAVEMPYELDEARGLWDPDGGDEGMLEALRRSYELHRQLARPRSKLVMGEWIENQPVFLSFDPKPKRWPDASDRRRPRVLYADRYESIPYSALVVSPEAQQIRAEIEMLDEQPDGWEITQVAGLDAVPF